MTGFQQKTLNTAIDVLMETDLVKRWAKGELKAYGIQEGTPEYDKFYKDKRRAVATKIINTAK